jgi:aspartate/methionine/tyrosine aminotransferase
MAKPIQDMAAVALTGSQAWLAARNEIYQARRDLALTRLAQMGLVAGKPKAALYIWFRVPGGYTSLQFQNDLLEKAHVSVAPGQSYGHNGEGWARLSLTATQDRLEEALSRMEKMMRKSSESVHRNKT